MEERFNNSRPHIENFGNGPGLIAVAGKPGLHPVNIFRQNTFDYFRSYGLQPALVCLFYRQGKVLVYLERGCQPLRQ